MDLSTQSPRRLLSISQKIGIVAGSFALPIAVLTYFVVSTINQNIAFGAKEMMGCNYQKPLERLLQALQDHQAGAGAADRVEREFAALRDVQARHGAELQFTTEGLAKRGRSHLTVDTMEQEWKDLARKAPAEQAAAYEHLVADLRGMITHAGDTSNLILDPDLDSYYLMDVTLLALPQTQERLARVASFGASVIARGATTPEERVQFAVHAAMLQEADLDRVVASSKTAILEDANFYGTSPTLQASLGMGLEAYSKANAEFIAMTRKLSESEKPAVDRDAYLAAAGKARAASFTYWGVGVAELELLLQARIDSYGKDRSMALGLSGIALLIAFAFSVVAARSITVPLTSLIRYLGPGANLLSGCVDALGKAQKGAGAAAEVGVICEELEAHAVDMRKSVDNLVSLVAGSGAPSGPSNSDSPVRPAPQAV